MTRETNHTPLGVPAVCLALGIVAGRCLNMSVTESVLVAGTGLFLALLSGRWGRLQSSLIWMTCMGAGCLLYSAEEERRAVEWPEEEGCWEVVVTSEPAERGKTLVMDCQLTRSGEKIRLRLMKDERSKELMAGDGLQICTRITPVRWRGYSGEAFVWSTRWKRCELSLNELGTTERARLFFLAERHKLLKQIKLNIREQDEYHTMAAMTLGDKSGISKEQREEFSVAGMSHLLALSGLHLGIIYMLLTMLLRRSRYELVNQLLTVSCIWAFAMMTGLSASVVRASVMITVYAFVSLLNRSKTPLNTLALTAIIMLVSRPSSLFDIGFQLSFSSVLSILLFVPLYEARGKWWSALWGMTSVSIAAQMGTAPLVAYYFGRFSVWFLLANYVAIPLTTVMLWSMVCLLLLSWWPAVQSIVAVVPATLASWLNHWASWIAGLPLSSIDGLHPTPLQVAMCYVVVGCVYYLLRYYSTHYIKNHAYG